MCSTRCCRRRADPADRRGAAGAAAGGADGQGEDEDALKPAAAHRHGGHHRRPQLGAAHTSSALLFNQSRAVAIDMESATIAAQGYRFRVPYGTLLCVSDKPLHGEIKLPGQANRFYERAIDRDPRI
jgi:hypothetical protein